MIHYVEGKNMHWLDLLQHELDRLIFTHRGQYRTVSHRKRITAREDRIHKIIKKYNTYEF